MALCGPSAVVNMAMCSQSAQKHGVIRSISTTMWCHMFLCMKHNNVQSNCNTWHRMVSVHDARRCGIMQSLCTMWRRAVYLHNDVASHCPCASTVGWKLNFYQSIPLAPSWQVILRGVHITFLTLTVTRHHVASLHNAQRCSIMQSLCTTWSNWNTGLDKSRPLDE